nr:MAG TPA: tail protein [Caudoviricetes sp.]
MIMDNRKIIQSFIPISLEENEDYKIFIDSISEVYGEYLDYVEMFPDLGGIETVPTKYIKDLSALVGYDYNESEDPEIQREISKRMFTAYKERGTEKSILNVASRSSDKNFVIGNLTYYNGATYKGYAKITYPVQELFTWNVSSWSGNHHFKDDERWRDGVIVIDLEVLNEKVRKAFSEVIPAGIKVYYNVVPQFGDDSIGGQVSFGEYFSTAYYDLIYDLPVKDVSNGLNLSNYLDYNDGKLSGRQVLFEGYYLDRYLKSTFNQYTNDWGLIKTPELDKPTNPTEVKVEYDGVMAWSYAGTLSGKYPLSGLRNGVIFMLAGITDIYPDNAMYPVEELENLKIDDLLTSMYNPEVEVYIIRD